MAGLVYLLGSGLYSVLPQLFWPERAEVEASVTCTDGLADLRSELLAQASDRVAAGGAQPGPLGPWIDDWDRRHLALEDRCTGEGATAWNLLARLRERVESTLERFDETEGDLDRALTRSLGDAAPPSSS